MRRAALLFACVTCACALAGAARAQTPVEQVARGIRAYRNLDYDSAATILRAALAQPGSALVDSDRVRGLVYLGASELYREHRDSAVALFGRLLRIDPRYHIDQLVFPPEITGLFQQVRLVTRAVAVVVAPVTELQSPGDALSIGLYATTVHPVDVAVLRPDGAPLRSLYQGSVGDSLQLRWDGRAADGNPPDSGRYLLQVDSRGSDGRVVRSVALPLDVSRVLSDTLPLPAPLPDSRFKPEHAPGSSGLRALATGLVAALAVAVLPSIVAGRSSAAGGRFLVAGSLGVAGYLGFRGLRRPQPIPDNIAANRALRLAWQHGVDSVHALNVARRHEVHILIRAVTSSIAVSTGAATQLVFTQQPSFVVAGATMSPAVTVTAEDALGNTVMTARGTVALALTTPGGATLTGGGPATASGGVATFSALGVDKAGIYTLTPSTTVSGVTTLPASAGFAVRAGAASAATSLVAVARTTVRAGDTVTVTLQARDSFGNNLTVGGSTVLLRAVAGTGTGTIAPGPATDRGNGTYSVILRGGTAGTVTTSATLDGAAVTTAQPTITVQ